MDSIVDPKDVVRDLKFYEIGEDDIKAIPYFISAYLIWAAGAYSDLADHKGRFFLDGTHPGFTILNLSLLKKLVKGNNLDI